MKQDEFFRHCINLHTLPASLAEQKATLKNYVDNMQQEKEKIIRARAKRYIIYDTDATEEYEAKLKILQKNLESTEKSLKKAERKALLLERKHLSL